MKGIHIMNYRTATIDDLDLLVYQRLKFIEVDENSNDYNIIKDNCFLYFKKAIDNDTCDVILAEDYGKCIGTGIIFYYDSVPSSFNHTGKNAYITSMYVEQDYRCHGIGMTILEKLVEKAEARGYKIIMLNASDMGKSIYKKLGFVEIKNGMLLDTRKR